MKDIPGFDGKYAATEDGKIWSYPRKWINGRGKTASHDGKWLTQIPDRYGYPAVGVRKDMKTKRLSVHRLVATTFIKNPNNLPQINHRNGIKTDNRVENLEWCTGAQNIQHGYDSGLFPRPTGGGKLSKAEVFEIRRLHKMGERGYKIALKFGISGGQVSHIIHHQSWSHV